MKIRFQRLELVSGRSSIGLLRPARNGWQLHSNSRTLTQSCCRKAPPRTPQTPPPPSFSKPQHPDRPNTPPLLKWISRWQQIPSPVRSALVIASGLALMLLTQSVFLVFLGGWMGYGAYRRVRRAFGLPVPRASYPFSSAPFSSSPERTEQVAEIRQQATKILKRHRSSIPPACLTLGHDPDIVQQSEQVVMLNGLRQSRYSAVLMFPTTREGAMVEVHWDRDHIQKMLLLYPDGTTQSIPVHKDDGRSGRIIDVEAD